MVLFEGCLNADPVGIAFEIAETCFNLKVKSTLNLNKILLLMVELY